MAGSPTPTESLAAAVERAGSQSALARICSVSQAAVWKWLDRAKQLPAEHVLKVEQQTGVSRHLLRPDIYPVEVPGAVGSVECDRSAVSQERAA